MWVMGVLLVVTSAASFVGVSLIPTTTGIAGATTAPVAGIAYGAGIMIAGFDPIANISWVRAVIVYAIFDVVSFIIAILFAAVILVLYPNKPALWMQGGMSTGARA